MVAVILFWLGAVFGSFAGAVTYRLKAKKDWVRARSQCESCGHQLSGLDLVPILSWLGLRGRCRYCGQKIGISNLLIEVLLGLVFAASYIFWPQDLAGGQWLLFVTWLAASIGLAILALYDFRWMILPNKVLYPTLYVALAGRLAYVLLYSNRISHDLMQLVLSVAVASGLFWAIYIGSKGKMIGFGDVRLGLVTGTLLAEPQKAALMIFFGSLLGSLFAIPSLAAKKTTLSARLPYGPFLIAATVMVMLFGDSIIDWYRGLLA